MKIHSVFYAQAKGIYQKGSHRQVAAGHLTGHQNGTQAQFLPVFRNPA